MVSRPEEAAVVKEAGFRSTGKYNVATAGNVRPDLTERYEQLAREAARHQGGHRQDLQAVLNQVRFLAK